MDKTTPNNFDSLQQHCAFMKTSGRSIVSFTGTYQVTMLYNKKVNNLKEKTKPKQINTQK